MRCEGGVSVVCHPWLPDLLHEVGVLMLLCLSSSLQNCSFPIQVCPALYQTLNQGSGPAGECKCALRREWESW